MSTMTVASCSPAGISSSSTRDEIVPDPDSNHASSVGIPTQIGPTHQVNGKDIGKPSSSGAVGDIPEQIKQSSDAFSFCPSKSQQRSSGATSKDGKSTEKNGEHQINGDGRSNSKETEVEALVRVIAADLNSMEKAREKMNKYEDRTRQALENLENLKKVGASADDLRDLKNAVKKLKQQIHKDEHEVSKEEARRNLQSIDPANVARATANKVIDKMPDLFKTTVLDKSADFEDFEACYNQLGEELKLCLLCFALFPENAEIKKRVMVYWWIGEGFASSSHPIQRENSETIEGSVPPIQGENNGVVPSVQGENEERTAQQFANDFFYKLIEKGFIEPACTNQKPGRVDVCKMHPFVRSMVIKLAKKANFFDFDEKGNAKEESSGSLRACLTGKGLKNIAKFENLHALFNVNEAILEFKPEWLSKMKNINVLYLGRWQKSAAHHIEVEETKIMKTKNANVLDGLENMKNLRFLSLQGISQITELPDTISKLTSLTILDLRACHNLESIPDGIGLLKNLTHLDMSECYLLDQMPKGLSQLSNLQVLGGFVVGELVAKNSCTLTNLSGLSKLRKLSIHTGVDDFPRKGDLVALYKFNKLKKLTIAWGRGSVENKRDETGSPIRGNQKDDEQKSDLKGSSTSKQSAKATKKLSPQLLLGLKGKSSKEADVQEPQIALLPQKLEKLDIQCFPRTVTPEWLQPQNLKQLEKLYIRGGKFSDLGQFQDIEGQEREAGPKKNKWGVKELRLKYLNELEMDWRELEELFPELVYLEKVKCPKLSFFPCDAAGIWMKK